MKPFEEQRPSRLQRLFSPLIAGAVAALPLAMTLGIVLWLAGFVQRFLGPKSVLGKQLGSIGLRFVTSETTAYLIGLLGGLLLLYGLGVLVQSGMKNRLSPLVDNMMRRVPVVSTIYDASKKLVGVFDHKEAAEMREMSPVICHFGGVGGTAVMALMPSSERIRLSGHDYHAVLIPTAPVPFGGALLYVPCEWVQPANIPFDGLFNVYMSMGVTSKEYLERASETSGSAESERTE